MSVKQIDKFLTETFKLSSGPNDQLKLDFEVKEVYLDILRSEEEKEQDKIEIEMREIQKNLEE